MRQVLQFIRSNTALKIFLVLAVFLILLAVLAKAPFREEPSGIEYQILEEPIASVTTCQSCDRSENYIYLLSGSLRQGTYLQILDIDGQFLRAILFDDHSNGSPSVRTQGDLAYIQLNNLAVFVLSGTEVIKQFSPDQAKAEGYVHSWFQYGARKVRLVGSVLYLTDDTGSTVSTVPFPYSFQKARSYMGTPGQLLVCGIAFLSMTALILVRWRRKGKPS